jgi:hypothetical protein
MAFLVLACKLDGGPGIDEKAFSGFLIAGQPASMHLDEPLGNESVKRHGQRILLRVPEQLGGGRVP